jgi:glycosyltransferase involved in cell wall biosynthesis
VNGGRTMDGRTGLIMNSFAGGGAERSTVLTAAAWPIAEQAVLITCRAKGPYRSESSRALVTAEIGVWPSINRLFSFGRRLDEIVRDERISALITNGYGLNQMVLLARAVRVLRGVGVIVVERNMLSVALVDRFPSRLVRRAVTLLTRWLYRRADAIVGVSEGVSRDLETTLRLPAGSVTTIYNPVDTDRIAAAISETIPMPLERAFAGLPRPIVITTGRLVTQKAHHDLLTAFAGLPDSHRGSLVILGEGPLRRDLEQQAQLLSVADRVWMPGFVANPWWFIARSDIFALSSHWEGHPRALLEALACGVPIASTNCPSGPSEILHDLPDTRLTPVGHPTELARAIHDLLSTTNRATSSHDLTRYDPHHVAARYREVANEIATRHTRSRWWCNA